MGYQGKLNRHHRKQYEGRRQALDAMNARMVDASVEHAPYKGRRRPTLGLECPVCLDVCTVAGDNWPTLGAAIAALAVHWQEQHPEEVSR